MATVRSSKLLAKLEHLDLIFRERRLCWFGHVELFSGKIRTECDMQVDGRWGYGGPRSMEETDIEILLFTTVDHQERSIWRSGVRSAMHAASQLPGRGPRDVDDANAPAC